MNKPPTAADLLHAAEVLDDHTATDPDVEGAVGCPRCPGVADALRMLAPFAAQMEKDPGNLAPMVDLLLQAQGSTPTIGGRDATSDPGSEADPKHPQ